MEIIPIGGNCFPDKREGAAGILWVRGFGGSQGQDRHLEGQEERGQVPTPAPSLLTRDISCYWNETSCPAVPQHLPLVLSSPIFHGSWTQAMRSARICQRMPSSARRQSLHSCPLCWLSCRTPSTASLGGCWPLGIPVSSFPEAAGSQPEPRSGSNPWSGAAAGAGSRCQTKGRGQRPGWLLPQGRGAGTCRARALSHPGAAAAPTSCACHAPPSTQPPPWLAWLGHSWVPGGPTLALVLCRPCHGHCAYTALV